MISSTLAPIITNLYKKMDKQIENLSKLADMTKRKSETRNKQGLGHILHSGRQGKSLQWKGTGETLPHERVSMHSQ